MSAEKGNTYAVGNEGGRPPIYDADKKEDVQKVISLCDSYFEELPPTKPPTITGLTLHLGFCHKSTLYDYSKKDMFSDPIKKAITKIEQYHEEATAFGDKCTGNIFILKNFGWRDTTDLTNNGKDLPATPSTIVFKKFNDE